MQSVRSLQSKPVRIFTAVSMAVFCLIFTLNLFAAEQNLPVSVILEPGVDANRVYRNINKRVIYHQTGGLAKPGALSSTEEKINYRANLLLSKVKQLLGMYPETKLKIRVFKTRDDLRNEYYCIFGRQCKLKTFYIHKFRTVYTTEVDISDSVLAHEIGHAVIDDYFKTVPPEKVAEMLASYVDLHLED